MKLPDGVTILANVIDSSRLSQIAHAYEIEVKYAADQDISVGRTTTRVLDFVNRGALFDALYAFEPLLAVCRETLRRPFRLSSFHARTVHPNVPAQQMHVDLAHDKDGARLISFIYMIDAFTESNGATGFGENLAAKACGPPGSLLIFDGALLHGHGANTTALPRRSLQGAFVRHTEPPATNFAERISPETLNRLSPTARTLLGLGTSEMNTP